MVPLQAGDIAPDFTLPADGSRTVSLSDYRGKFVVLYFYPKDDTPGCTVQAVDFTARKADFEALGAVVVGVSKDSVAKHDKFIAKHGLDLTLGSDETGEMLARYGAWVEKSMYGKKYMGIQRSTVLIDRDGTVLKVWPKVRAKGHADDVLEALKMAVAADP